MAAFNNSSLNENTPQSLNENAFTADSNRLNSNYEKVRRVLNSFPQPARTETKETFLVVLKEVRGKREEPRRKIAACKGIQRLPDKHRFENVQQRTASQIDFDIASYPEELNSSKARRNWLIEGFAAVADDL